MEQVKKCCRCKRSLPLTSFHFRKRSGDGLNSACKQCVKVETARYQKKNSAQLIEKCKAWREKNAAHVKEYNRAYYAKNQKEMQDRSRQYRAANPTKHRETARSYKSRNRDSVAKYYAEKTAQLADSYVINKLARDGLLKPQDIPQEFIKLKRAQLLLTRELRRRKK